MDIIENIITERIKIDEIKNNDLIVLRLDDAKNRTNEEIKRIFSIIKESFAQDINPHLLVLDLKDEISLIPSAIWQKISVEAQKTIDKNAQLP